MAYVDFDGTMGGTMTAQNLREALPVHEQAKLESDGFDVDSGALAQGTVAFSKAPGGGKSENAQHQPKEHGLLSSTSHEIGSPNPNGSQGSPTPKPKVTQKLETRHAFGRNRYAELLAKHGPSPQQPSIHALKSMNMSAEPTASSPVTYLSAVHLMVPKDGAGAKRERHMDHMASKLSLGKRMEKLGANLGIIDAPSMAAF